MQADQNKKTVSHSDTGLGGTYVAGCWCWALMTSAKFWFSFAGAFAVIGGFIFAWPHLMMADYQQTEVMWRPMAEMKPLLFVVAAAIKALAYTFLILAAMRTARWGDAIMAGCKLGMIGIALGIVSWNIMPFADWHIPAKWAVGYFFEAMAVAIVVKAINHFAVKA